MTITPSQVIIIDIGSGFTKVGFANSSLPPVIVPTVVGKIKNNLHITDVCKEVLVGNDLNGKEGLYNKTWPVKQGVITSWDDFKIFLSYLFHEQLKTTPDSAFVVLAVSPLTSQRDAENLVSVLFNDFKVPACFIANNAALSLSMSGVKTGVVVDMGYDAITITPIIEGITASQLMIGGEDLTDYMKKILGERGYIFTTPEERRTVEKIKTEVTFVADDFEQNMATTASTTSLDKEFITSGGESFTVGNERFRCPESIFQPELLGKDTKGLHEIIESTVRNVYNELRRNIYICGGSSLFDGLSERLKKELCILIPSQQNINVSALPEQNYSAWTGATKLVSQLVLDSEWITREDFEKEGPIVVHWKCKI